jgi:hypothetical protein
MATPGQIKMQKRLFDLEEKVQLLSNAVCSLTKLMEYHHGKEDKTDDPADQKEQDVPDTEHDAEPVSAGGVEGVEQGASEEGHRGEEPDKQSQRRGRKTVQSKA